MERLTVPNPLYVIYPQELQSDMDSLQLEVRRKESNLDMVNTEKERLDQKLRLLSGTVKRESFGTLYSFCIIGASLSAFENETSRKYIHSKKQLFRTFVHVASWVHHWCRLYHLHVTIQAYNFLEMTVHLFINCFPI